MTSTLRLRRALLGSGAAIALMAGPALAGQSDDLKTQIDRLQTQVDQLQKQQSATDAKAVAAPADAVVGGDYPGSFKLPGSDTSFSIHGYVKLDFIYDADQQLGDSAGWTGIQANGTPAQRRDGEFRVHAKQSRINFQTRTPTSYGQLKTYIEADFLGATGNQSVSNSTSFRLRHAYGELGPVLGGQTWTNWMDPGSLPETLDFDGPVGVPFARQGQIRYTQGFGKFTFSASAENPQGDITANTGATSSSSIPKATTDPVNKIDRMPDLTARVTYGDTWGYVGASGLIRRLEVDNGGGGATGTPNLSSDATGGGGLVFGTVHVKSILPSMPAMLQKDELGFQGFYGSGLGRYVAIGGGLNDAAVAKYNTGSLATATAVSVVTQMQEGGVAWYQHWWTDQLRTNLAYGIQHNHWSNAIAFSTSQTDRLQTIHANLIWSPVKAVNIGLEFMYGTRDIRKNPTTGLSQTGDAKRVQFSMQYVF